MLFSSFIPYFFLSLHLACERRWLFTKSFLRARCTSLLFMLYFSMTSIISLIPVSSFYKSNQSCCHHRPICFSSASTTTSPRLTRPLRLKRASRLKKKINKKKFKLTSRARRRYFPFVCLVYSMIQLIIVFCTCRHAKAMASLMSIYVIYRDTKISDCIGWLSLLLSCRYECPAGISGDNVSCVLKWMDDSWHKHA